MSEADDLYIEMMNLLDEMTGRHISYQVGMEVKEHGCESRVMLEYMTSDKKLDVTVRLKCSGCLLVGEYFTVTQQDLSPETITKGLIEPWNKLVEGGT